MNTLEIHKSAEAGVYARDPVTFYDSIPVFSLPDEYIGNYEQISADHIAAITEENENPWIPEDLWRALEASTIGLVDRYSKPGDLILDVGVGLGRLLSHFPSLQKYGMDISTEYLKRAQAKGIEVCYSRVEDMPYKPAMFDVITATDVFEHVWDLTIACEKILSVLKPGGVLVIRVPYREDLSGYLEPDYPYKYVHLRNFEESSLRVLFERMFDCECIDWALSVPYLQGPTRLKYRLPSGEMRFYAWLQRIEKSKPKLYKKLAQKLVLPLEINVAVRKPDKNITIEL